MKRDMKAEKKIVDCLLDHPEEKMYLSQIARASNASGSTCHQVLERKVNEGLLEKEKLGNLSMYVFSLDDPFNRQLKITRTIEILKPLIEELKKVAQKIILFGSAAQGKDAVDSDFDLFILSSEKQEIQRIIKKNKLGKKIKPVIKNFLEFVEFKKQDRFFYEEINKGKILWEEKRER